jgi:WD40 repeat protein
LIDLPPDAKLLGFTPDTQALVVKYSGGSLHFLNTTSGTEENWFRAPTGLSGIEFTSTGDKWLTAIGNQIITGRTSDGENLRTITAPKEASDGFRKAVWHPDGRRIAAAWLNDIGLWDAETGRQLSVLKGHESAVVGLVFTHTGEYLISASWDGTTRLWDTEKPREVLILPESGNGLSISSDDRRLSFQTWDNGQMKLYELSDLTAGQRLTLPPQTRIDHFTTYPVFSRHGGLLLARDEDGIFVFRPPSPAPVALVPVAGEHSVCLARDEKTLFTGGAKGAQGWPMKWSADRSELHIGPPEVLAATRDATIDGVFLARDGQWLVTRGQNGVMAFQPEVPSKVVRFDKGILAGNYPESISPDARWVSTILSSLSQIQIWNGRTGKMLTNFPADFAYQCAFSPNGQWLACSQKDSTMIVDTKTWRVVRRIVYPGALANHGLAFSPDGRILATFASDWRIRLLNFETGDELASFPAGRMPTSVSFNSAGDRLAVANQSGYVQLWDLRRVREQLASFHLDWEMPAYGLEQPPSSARPLRGIVHTGAPSTTASQKPIVRKEIVPTPNQVEEVRRSIPARDVTLSPTLIDLSSHYNGSLLKVWGHNPGNDLANLTPGVHRLGGINYDVRGLIQVRPYHNPGLPSKVTQIQIGRKCTRLHFLHMTGYIVKKDTKVGAYIIHFKSGQRHEKPILFGRDLDNWWFRPGRPPTEAKVVWTGSNAEAERYGEKIRLFHTTWENPWPDLEVASLDMVSTLTECNPCLLAITVQ